MVLPRHCGFIRFSPDCVGCSSSGSERYSGFARFRRVSRVDRLYPDLSKGTRTLTPMTWEAIGLNSNWNLQRPWLRSSARFATLAARWGEFVRFLEGLNFDFGWKPCSQNGGRWYLPSESEAGEPKKPTLTASRCGVALQRRPAGERLTWASLRNRDAITHTTDDSGRRRRPMPSCCWVVSHWPATWPPTGSSTPDVNTAHRLPGIRRVSLWWWPQQTCNGSRRMGPGSHSDRAGWFCSGIHGFRSAERETLGAGTVGRADRRLRYVADCVGVAPAP